MPDGRDAAAQPSPPGMSYPSEPHSKHDDAAVERRAAVLEETLDEANPGASAFADEFIAKADEHWVSCNGARIVARAWTDPEFRARLLANGREAIMELGLAMPPHHRHLVVLENTPTVHNVIVCTLCSCTAFTMIGIAPNWYKDLVYRARVVRQSRTVLREMGLDLPPGIEIRVWDTTADTRYMVLPLQPSRTEGWSEEQLADVVTQDAMIGVSRL